MTREDITYRLESIEVELAYINHLLGENVDRREVFEALDTQAAQLEDEQKELMNLLNDVTDAYYPEDDNLSDVEADAMTRRDAGMGTDEDYGYFGDTETDLGY